MNLLKSIGAVLAGFVLVVALSIGTDLLLSQSGIMKMPFDNNQTWFICVVVLYRTIYGIAGIYLTAQPADEARLDQWMYWTCDKYNGSYRYEGRRSTVVCHCIGCTSPADSMGGWKNE